MLVAAFSIFFLHIMMSYCVSTVRLINYMFLFSLLGWIWYRPWVWFNK